MSIPGGRILRKAILAVTAVVAFAYLAPLTVGGAASYVIVSGSSMLPTLENGDLVVVHQTHDYVVGDIVAFQTESGAVIHRIVGVGDEGFVMQGDNKENPDSWTPSDDDILGEHSARVPGAGGWLTKVRQSPGLLGAVVGGLGTLGLWNTKRRARRRGAHSTDRRRHVARQAAGGGTSLRGAGATIATLAVLAAVVGVVLAFLLVRPGRVVEPVDIELYEHRGDFDYVAMMEPSIIYDSQTLRPTDGPDPLPIYTQLLDTIEFDFSYLLGSATADAAPAGAVSADLQIRAGEEGWTRRLELAEPQPFQGSAGSMSFVVDWSAVSDLIATAETEAGLIPPAYQLTILAEVIPDDASVERFVAELPMTLGDTELTIDDEALTVDAPVVESREMLTPNDLDVFGLTFPIEATRIVVGSLFAVLVVATLGYGLFAWRKLGRGEIARIRMVYGSLIVPVTNGPGGERSVDVATMADLARLARKGEQMVFYYRPHPDEHRFFVPDGHLTYEYQIDPREGA